MLIDDQYVDDEIELDEVLQKASQVDPLQHASDLDLAANTMLPVDVVQRNRDQIKKSERAAYIDSVDLAANNPKTAAFISNYNNAAVSLDHVEALQGMEDDVKRHNTNLLLNTGKNFANTAVKLTGDFLQFAGHTSDSFEETMTELTGVNPGIEWGDDGLSFSMKLDPKRQDDQMYGKMLSEYKPFDYVENFNWDNLKEDPSIMNLAGYIVEQGGGSLPHMIAAMYTAPAYLMSRTEDIAENRMVNMGSEENPTWNELGKSFVPALAVAVSERLAGKVVLGRGGVTGVGSGVKAVGGAAATEAGTEFIQEGIEYLGETVGTKKVVDFGEMIDRQFAGAVAGGGVGGGIRGITATHEAIANRNGQQVANVMSSLGEQDTIDRMVAYAQSENLDQVGPLQHKEFLQSVGEDIDIIVSGDAVSELQTESEYFADANGEDVHIPLDVFVSEIAPDVELMAELRPHIKTSGSGLTMQQLDSGDSQHKSAIRKLLESAEKEEAIKSEADEIYNQVVQQIVDTRRQGQATARISAQIIPAYVTSYVARARDRGFDISVKDTFAKMGLKIVGPQEAAAPNEILNQAQEDGYKGSNEQQAVEWNEAVSKGMLMDEESRRIRADNMNVEFDPNSAHDPAFKTGPSFDSEQKFSDLTISESIIIEETGETVQVERNAQEVWDETQSRKSELQQLLACIRG